MNPAWKSRLWLLVLITAGLAPAVFSQITTATIVGTVTDPSGAVLPGAQISARNVETGLIRNVVSSDVGAYRLEFLPIGNYVIELTAAGFKKASRSGIELQVNDTSRVDIVLQIGQVSETVTV